MKVADPARWNLGRLHPLRMGGGTRFKILEAAALGKAMVSTSLGCEGFPVQNGRELVIADSPREFADAVAQLVRDPARRANLGARARRLADEYDWKKIIPQMEAVYLRGATRESLRSREESIR